MKQKIKICIIGIGILLLVSAMIPNLFRRINLIEKAQAQDTEIAIFLNDTKTNQIPAKDSGYYFNREKTNCTNGATINWNSVTWNPEVHNLTTTRTKCELHFTTVYTEGILNGTDPVIKNELVPVTIQKDGTVRKANLNSKWYAYANQEWANAVILQNSYDVLNKKGKVISATKKDGYVSFDGTDDAIDLGLANYDFKDQITMAIKLKFNDTKSSTAILNNFESAGAGFTTMDWNEKIRDNKMGFMFYNVSEKKYIQIRGPQYNINEIYTLVATYNGTYLKLYINGELIETVAITGNIKPAPFDIFIGGNPVWNSTFTEYSNIDVYQVAIYNRAVSEEEIKENMSESIKVNNTAGLLSYADFSNKVYGDHEIIPEDVIESYFVWIPRYKYKIFNEGNYDTLTSVENKVQAIDVVFETKEVIQSAGTKINDWLTHPAFTAFNTNGMWVGKYETSKYSGSDNQRNGEAVQIKPNVFSWRSIQIGNAFYTSYDYKRDLDSHMMKNTEWGAVAYLQHSAYGSQASVRINNNSSYITGYAANNEPTCGYTATNEECNRYCSDGTCNQPYNTETGYLASTTANITGIYDMSGGAWENMMSVMLDEHEKPMSGRNGVYNSMFKGTLGCPTCDNDTSGITSITSGYDFPEAQYYDTYAYSTSDQHYGRRILGDATGEMGAFEAVINLTQTRSIGSWYSDDGYFVKSSFPWFARGGDYSYGLSSGAMSFANSFGSVNPAISFRIVLSP